MSRLEQFPARCSADPSHLTSCLECGRQGVAAEGELGAFMKAVELLYGRVESLRAAEYWLALAEGADVPLVDGSPVWRDITIQAASLFVAKIDPAARLNRLQEGTYVS